MATEPEVYRCLLTDFESIMSVSNTPSTGLLLEVLKVLKTSADGAVEVATQASNGATAERHAGAVDANLILGVLQATADGAKAVAEAARLGASPIIGTAERAAPQLLGPHESIVRIPSIEPSKLREVGDGPFVLNERVGSISVAAWEGLSEEKLKELDDALRGIAGKASRAGLGWGEAGEVIEQELAAVGLQFATESHFSVQKIYLGHAKDSSLSDLMRVHAMKWACKFGMTKWYADEMIRVVQRLMELRGFKI